MIAATDCAYGTCTSAEGTGYLIGMLIGYVVILGLALWLYARIVGKAGYSRWWVLIVFVPLANLVAFVLFAAKEWPVERELRALRLQAAVAGGRSISPARFGDVPYTAGAYGPPAPGYGDPYGQGAYGSTPTAPYGAAPTTPYGAQGSAPEWPAGGPAYGQPPQYGQQPPYPGSAQPGPTDPTQRPPSWG
ncbi:hypothetical protein [Cellulomonas alba]|uniref:Cardiolipin synthase N-terminal domain-containing protein n=1 Tax=Cellulomonas alba TaxID=3053467 RepID=A0ABT7SK61_9CELL|nr:hypothetical protein [Cellulomonas alba]MDM7856581.1 hypothetical protein [Cellulomonas alba]